MSPWWPIVGLSLVILACTPSPESDGNQGASRPQAPVANLPDNDCDEVNRRADRDSAAVETNSSLSEPEREIALVRIAAATGQCGMRPVPPGTPDPPDISRELAAIYVDAVDAARRIGPRDGDCRAAIGAQRADALEAICSQVSGATHPPCNAVNSCDLLVGEVDRNCDRNMARRSPRLCSAARPNQRDR